MPNPPRKLRSKPSTKNLIRTLSKLGLCSRTQALVHVQAGRVTVNGRCVKEPGYVVRPKDVIQLNGETVQTKAKRYFLFHKPAGCVTTRSDEKGRKTVYDYLKGIPDWVAPVGRLDQDSEGLLLLTNNGELARFLELPQNKLKRVYKVRGFGKVEMRKFTELKRGVVIDGIKYGRADVKFVRGEGMNSWFEAVLCEGKNREVRRLFEYCGLKVNRLIRVAFGPYELSDLKLGQTREVMIDPKFLKLCNYF